MAVLSINQVAAAAYAAGFRGRPLVEITAIAMAESGGNTHAFNPSGERSVGLTQINMRAHGTRFGSQAQLMNPVHNMRAAYALSGGGRSFRPWSVHRSSPSPHAGMSNRFLSQAHRAASGAAGTPIPNVGVGPGDTSAPRATFGNQPDPFAESARQDSAQQERVMQVIQGMMEARKNRGRGQVPGFASVPTDAFDPGQFSQQLGSVGARAGALTPQVARGQAPPRGRGRSPQQRMQSLSRFTPGLDETRRRREEDEELLRGLGGGV